MTAPARYANVSRVLEPLSVVPFIGPQNVSLLPQTVNLELYQGDDVWLSLVCTDPDGEPADLSGAVALSQIRANVDSEVLVEFSTSILDNEITLWLPHIQATQLTPGRGVWDCQITANGRVTTLVAGIVIIVPEVSR